MFNDNRLKTVSKHQISFDLMLFHQPKAAKPTSLTQLPQKSFILSTQAAITARLLDQFGPPLRSDE